MLKKHFILFLILFLPVINNIYSTPKNKGKKKFNEEVKEKIRSTLIRGIVIDSFGEPIAGVIVENGINKNYTDSKGYYEIYADTTLLITYSFLGKIMATSKIGHNKTINCQIDI